MNKSEANEVNPILALRHGPVLRTAAAITLIAFASLYLQPVAMAAHVANKQMFGLQHKPRASAEHELAATVDQIQARLKSMHTRLGKHESISKDRDDLNTLRADLDQQDKAALAHFVAIGKLLREKHLPAVILQRQVVMVKKYKAHMRTLRANLEAIHKARNDSERLALTQKAWQGLKAVNKKRPWPKFDPNNLPNKSLKPNLKNKPRLHRKDFLRAGLTSNPTVKLAALGDFTYDKLPDASNPAYLAATPEVTLTPAIKAKAQALNYNPVKIYNWVRNNVQWIPTWGATQDADMTLGSLRGNAMDISSLLIALYRASGIPSRYVHGTIQVSASKFMNWAGGFTNITAAMDYASSGGIPITGVVNGGQVTQVQMEHIWVEAAIDFHPSRGAVNKSADTWVQLDPSYKQYVDHPGMDVVSDSGIDLKSLTSSYIASGTVNTQEGWAAGLDQDILLNALTQAQTQAGQYIQTNDPTATAADIIGERSIVAGNAGVLPTGPSYQVLVVGARYGALPSSLENSMTFALGTDSAGDPINPVTYPMARLNNHKVTLSFPASTAADAATLASFYPTLPITDLSQVPTSIPAYLINVTPQLAIDGKLVLRGQPMQLGQALDLYYGLKGPDPAYAETYTYPVTAGSYESVMVLGGSVSSTALQNLRNKLQATETTVTSGDQASIDALTREDYLGDIFYAGNLSYFAQYLGFSHIVAHRRGTPQELRIAYGTFGYEPGVQYEFGIPSAITIGGYAVNVLLRDVIGSVDGDQAKRRNTNIILGSWSSALENQVPQEMMSTPSQPVQGISAVAALQLASEQGQRIYAISQANAAQVLPNLHFDSSAMAMISEAVANGKQVIASTDPVSVPGWTGEGYVILDPQTGDGAYQIEGGENGGFAMTEPTSFFAAVGNQLNRYGFGEGVGAVSKVFEGALEGISLGETFVEIQQDCGPGVALAVTLLIGAINEVLDIAYDVLSISLLASGVGIIGFLLLALFSWLFTWLIDTFIKELTEDICRFSFLSNSDTRVA